MRGVIRVIGGIFWVPCRQADTTAPIAGSGEGSVETKFNVIISILRLLALSDVKDEQQHIFGFSVWQEGFRSTEKTHEKSPAYLM